VGGMSHPARPLRRNTRRATSPLRSRVTSHASRSPSADQPPEPRIQYRVTSIQYPATSPRIPHPSYLFVSTLVSGPAPLNSPQLQLCPALPPTRPDLAFLDSHLHFWTPSPSFVSCGPPGPPALHLVPRQSCTLGRGPSHLGAADIPSCAPSAPGPGPPRNPHRRCSPFSDHPSPVTRRFPLTSAPATSSIGGGVCPRGALADRPPRDPHQRRRAETRGADPARLPPVQLHRESQ
jgi:hypothetical protein